MPVKSFGDVDDSVSSVLVASLAASPAGSRITKSPDTRPVVILLPVPSVSIDSASMLTMLEGTDAACAIPASSAESTTGSATNSSTLLARRPMVPPIVTARTVTVEVAVVLWGEVVLREVSDELAVVEVCDEVAVVLLHDAEVRDELAVVEVVLWEVVMLHDEVAVVEWAVVELLALVVVLVMDTVDTVELSVPVVAVLVLVA